MMEATLATKSKFSFCPVGKNEENKITPITFMVFQEHRFAQLPDKCLASSEEIIVCIIGGDQVEIKVREGIRSAPGIRASWRKAATTRSSCLASCYKAVINDLVVMRHL